MLTQRSTRVGDVTLAGYYAPCSLPGRSLAFHFDVQNILTHFVFSLTHNKLNLRPWGTYNVFLRVFQQLRAAPIVSTLPLEDSTDTWELLLGVIDDTITHAACSAEGPTNRTDGVNDEFMRNRPSSSPVDHTDKVSTQRDDRTPGSPLVVDDRSTPSDHVEMNQTTYVPCLVVTGCLYLLHTLFHLQRVQDPASLPRPLSISLACHTCLVSVAEYTVEEGVCPEFLHVLTSLQLRRQLVVVAQPGLQLRRFDAFGSPMYHALEMMSQRERFLQPKPA